MGLLGLSLIVASVVYVIIRPPPWLPPALLSWLPRGAGSPAAKITDARKSKKPRPSAPPPPPPTSIPTIAEPREATDRAPMPPPPPIMVVQPPPSVAVEHDDEERQRPESPTTPKAKAAQPSRSMPPPPPPPPPPSFSLTTESMPPPPRPTPSASSSSSSTMPPPPPPPSSLRPSPTSSSAAPAPRPPTLSQFPAANSAQRARGPLPNRGGGGLAPPPTHTSVPTKPSRQVTLDPGHSPLDWARLSGNGGADLRGLPAGTPYLRVTPSALRRQTGRRGTDAWMALGGRVYNVTPYARFHPGGVGELMRGAGRDGTRLFAEVHPWVNYENMLAACLVGILVEEPAAGDDVPGGGGCPESEMEAMD